VRRLQAATCSILVSIGAAGCTTESDTRLGRHFDAEPWGGAIVETVQDPAQWVPVATLVIATPIIRTQDEAWSDSLQQNHPVTGSSTRSGDVVMGGLAVASAGLAFWNWYDGDHAQSLEVAAESFALTGLETSIMKDVVGRRRPNHGQPNSFPSGHASFSFAASTFLARSIWATEEEGQESFWTEAAGWACYLPAAWVGMNRIETGRHFPSDVTAGAALGIFTTNMVWNAHYGEPDSKRESIYKPEHPVSTTLAPLILNDGFGLILQVRF
jgi:hypothetical protein